MARRRGRKGPALTPKTPSCKDAAMLLYEAPTGMAIFSFDGGYLDKQVEDFWACIPQLVLRVFMKHDMDSSFFDLDNGTIDNRLAKRLTMWCCSEKKLIVGSAKYKKIIEENLAITCVFVNVPDNEVVNGLKNPMRIILPEEKSETTKKNLIMGEEAILFLRQYKIDVKPEMVDEYLVEAAQCVYRIELRQKEHLKFLRILLKDFMVISGVDTTGWKLIHFATAPKLICHPEASYQMCHPVKIYSYDDYVKIETNAPRYKRSFSKIDALAVYEDVFSLHTEMSLTLLKLRTWLERAEKLLLEKAEVTRLCKDHFSGEPNGIDLPTTDSYPLEAPNRAEPTLQVIPSENCVAKGHHCLVTDKVQEKLAANMDGVERNKQVGDTGVQSMYDGEKKLTASALVMLGNKKDEHTDSSVKEMNLNKNMGDDEKNNHSSGTEGTPATSMSSKSERNKQKEVIPARNEMLKYGPLKDLNGDGKKPTASTPGPLGKQDEHADTSKQEVKQPGGDDEKNKHSRGTEGTPATSMSSKSERNKQKEVIPARNEMLKYGPLKDLNGDGKKPTASTPGPLGKQDEHTDTSKQEVKQPAGDKENVQSMDRGQKKPRPVLVVKKNEEFTATSTRYNSGFNVLNKGIIATSSSSNFGPDKENEMIPITSNGDYANYGKARDNAKIPEITDVDEDKMFNPASGEITQSGRLRDLIYEEMAREASSGGKTPPYKVGRRSKAMKQLCMPFICYHPVH